MLPVVLLTAKDAERRGTVHARHHHVQQDGVGALGLCQLDALCARRRAHDVDPADRLQREGGDLAHVVVVVDDQDPAHRCPPWCSNPLSRDAGHALGNVIGAGPRELEHERKWRSGLQLPPQRADSGS
jgi:hypothetical protein